MRQIFGVLFLIITGCASAPRAHVQIEVSDEKLADDQRIAALAEGNMTYDKILIISHDGLVIPAYLFKPLQSSDELLPVVIYLHGGEHGMFSSRRMHRVQPFIERGWIVLALDYRGSSGYGETFYDAADYGGGEIDDVLAARDWLIERHYALANHIAVLGSSHGGYNSLMAVARQPDSFAACVDFYGPTDLVYRVTSTPDENPNAAPGDPEKFARMVGVTVEENIQAYRDRSPRFLADRIRTPVLVIHGTEDEVVHIRESKWLVEALQDAGRTRIEFIRVEGGHHGYPTDSYGDAWDRALQFLQQYLDPS